mgnify:CR=1 FL=1
MGTPGRYQFYKIFTPVGSTYIPKFNVRIAGIFYPKDQPLAQPTNFGGINLNNYAGKDIAGNWNPVEKILDILGFF